MIWLKDLLQLKMTNADMMLALINLVDMVKDIKETQNVILAKLDEIPGTSASTLQLELELAEDLALPVQSKEDMDELAVILKNDRSKRRKLVSVHVNSLLLKYASSVSSLFKQHANDDNCDLCKSNALLNVTY